MMIPNKHMAEDKLAVEEVIQLLQIDTLTKLETCLKNSCDDISDNVLEIIQREYRRRKLIANRISKVPLFSEEQCRMLIMKNLKSLRYNKGITQSELAHSIGVSGRLYGHYETGYRIPPINVLVRLSEFYGVSIDYIVKQNE